MSAPVDVRALNLSKNDVRMLYAAERACAEWDGVAPHGAAEWIAIRRLESKGLVDYFGMGICEDCDTASHRADPTEVHVYRLTEMGKKAHEDAYERGIE